MEKENLEERVIEIVFFGGTTGKAEYKIDKSVDDYIQEDFRKAWEGNDFWYPLEYEDFELKIGEKFVDEIDMRKVIGVQYN